MNYRIAFCGLGSIAKRHLTNVSTYLTSQGDSCSVDLYRSSLGNPLPDELKHLVSETLLYANEIPANRQYDAVFVTNPTSMHYETVLKFAEHTSSFFIEKPIFDSITLDKKIFKTIENKTSYVACPLRYNPVLQYVKQNINLNNVYAARAISSSYLPDWRPGQDYRKTYSAHKNLGGGVSIDLIHEWDYLTSFFGIPKKCYSIHDKISSLDIDSDDIAIYIAKAGKTTIELHLDYFGRYAIRTLDLFMPDETIQCDILNGTISYKKEEKTIQLDCERNTFQLKEIEHFFDIITHKIDNDSTAEHAFAVLKLAKGL